MSNDTSTVVWSLVDLLLCCTCFMQLDESYWGICLAGSRKNGIAYYPVLHCLHVCDIPYTFRIWAALPCFELSDAFLSYCYKTGLWFSYSGHPGSIMWVVTGWIGGDGNSRRWQSPEFLLDNIGILMASIYKLCCWQWPSVIRSIWAGCSRGSEEPLVLVSPYFEMLDSALKDSCLMLAIDIAGTYLEITLLYTGSMTPGEICYKVCWLATTDPCVADSPENLLSPLKRLILMTHATKVMLPWSHWEVYCLPFQ